MLDYAGTRAISIIERSAIWGTAQVIIEAGSG